ncbi:FadR/GntR family transcriptional regulator [Pseudomonas sp. BP8]|uniref:FadR/GntR family transcriptional regulator n=1 Tax=Pseudomonas sp. BP8 TaxID=2817864 RepID=UPI001AE8B945|nr:FadR/GntR family transcriptional regulator [Pseudomonas sp. BP8]MBP2261714.1 DNA-binding FadR family transcriptional regulator [Pseudomonas sp. BP8]HDS1733809.1 FadR family transcriptional regulator [Pseudomonas putida]
MERGAPDRRVSLAQQLVLDLSRRILAGELPAGSKLPTEQAFTEERGVSRTVVREAMSRLQAEGLVETRRGIGTFVVDTSRPGEFPDNAADKGSGGDAVAVFELRLSLEVEAAAIAAQRATPSQLQTIRAALDEANRAGLLRKDGSRVEFEFHLQIALCTANSFFIDAMTHIGNTLISGVQQALTEQQRAVVIEEREQIYAALVRNDTEVARAAMRLHLSNGLHRALVAAPVSADG